MEVSESEWVAKAIGNVDKYLNRGGPGQGDEPQYLGGCELLNVIGFAMGLPIEDPKNWTQTESELAFKGELCYFKGDARLAINVIVDRITETCNGDRTNFITVLPIEMYLDGKLYELPLFRVQRYKSSSPVFVDNIGRCYSTFSDWHDNNMLPPCRMLYPADGKLTKRPGFEYSNCHQDDTPSNQTSSKVMKGVDIGASVVGITAAVGSIFLTGGLALPFVVAGAGTAVYGTGRSVYHLYDRGSHGQSLNPFTDSQSRMLWLGVAANIVSFGAMGASMRLGYVVTRGKEASEALQLFVNIANGTNLVVSGVAIINSTAFLIENFDDLSAADVLLQVMAIAFWTKGAMTYRTASQLITQYQESAFQSLSQNMSPEERQHLNNARASLNNDQRILRAYHLNSKDNIIPRSQLSEVLGQAATFGGSLNEEGLLVIGNGHTISLEMVNLPSDVRAEMFRTMGAFSPEMSKTFESLRNHVGDDLQLVRGIFKVAVKYNMSPQEAAESVLKMWTQFKQQPVAQQNVPFVINENGLTIGHNGLVYSHQQLVDFTPQNRAFVVSHLIGLSSDQTAAWHQIAAHMKCNEGQLMNWIQNNQNNLRCVLRLVPYGLFKGDVCPVTSLVDYGNAVVELNRVLRVSAIRLSAILDGEELRKLLVLVSKTSATVLTKEAKDLVNIRLRLRFEFQRQRVVDQFKRFAHVKIQTVLSKQLQPYEMDRLYTIDTHVQQHPSWSSRALEFANFMNPGNVSELAAYVEFAICKAEAQIRFVKDDIAKYNKANPKKPFQPPGRQSLKDYRGNTNKK